MPNIWFPPHSGPIPPRLAEVAADLKRPLTPPAKQPSSDGVQVTDVALTKAAAARRRVNYDQPTSLLTPPLTPSSSLRTTTSVESVASAASDGAGVVDPDPSSTRYLMVSNVRKDLDPQTLKFGVLQALDSPSVENIPAGAHRDKIKGISTHFHPSQGVVILVFYDVRQASSASVILSTPTTGALAQCIGEEGTWFECSFVTAEDVLELVGGYSFVMEPPPSFGLAVEVRADDSCKNGDVDLATLLGVLKVHGGLRTLGRLEEINKTSNRQLFRVEFFDVRDNESALHALNGQTFFNLHLSVVAADVLAQLTRAPNDPNNPSLDIAPAGHKSQLRKRFLSVNTFADKAKSHEDGGEATVDSPPLFYESTSPTATTQSHESQTHRRGSEQAYLDPRPPLVKRSRSFNGRDCHVIPVEYAPQFYSGSPPLHPFQYSYAPPAMVAYGPEFDPAHFIHMNGWSFDQAMMMPTPYGGMVFPPPPPGGPWVGPPNMGAPPPPMGYVPFPSPLPSEASSLTKQPMNGPAPPPPRLAATAPPSAAPHVNNVPPRILGPNGHIPGPGSTLPVPAAVVAANNDRNQLNIARIEEGQDTRTTVMIKNIPNKMNDKDLLSYISNVCHRRVDFLYLRMDFQNGCNVGYAFVNFISVEDLLKFAKAKLGEKWNMFSSEKVLQMSYANYHPLMEERTEWQPKIFYSSGPEQGLPEPFPPPTRLRRMERGALNRGLLYGPGFNLAHAHGGGNHTNGHANNDSSSGHGRGGMPPMPAARRHQLENARPPRRQQQQRDASGGGAEDNPTPRPGALLDPSNTKKPEPGKK
uniref:RRM domain-containing protein n=1 Tax=Mycena chlorophos TaxID=658473 RepID=A0ABQ0M1S4_MYCCL|nr:predicted protein [Mycena chlorophos]